MAAANLTTHLPILQVLEKAGTTPFTSSQPEAQGQTFLSGTPVQLNGSGFVIAWDGSTVTAGILGIAESFSANLGSAGLGAPVAPFGGVTGNIATATYGSVVNQPSAVNIALGTPVTDGRTLYIEPNQDNIFQALYDNSTGTTAANWTTTQATVGAILGLTKDANGYWYVDCGKTGAASCVQVVGLPMGPGLNSLVNFVFLTAAVQVA